MFFKPADHGSGWSSCPSAGSSLKPSRRLRFSLQSGAYEHESCASSRDPGEQGGLADRCVLFLFDMREAKIRGGIMFAYKTATAPMEQDMKPYNYAIALI